ncbi:MAG: hypothetical protein HKO68_01005, partial [Desulfobacterales bacterium]|nr:hypothetical protein [Desulfobacterales bacterium]
MFAMPMYEMRYHDWEEWEEISEIELMDGLYKIYNKVTPAIKEMITGKEIVTPEAVYRLKWKGGEQSDRLSKEMLTAT